MCGRFASFQSSQHIADEFGVMLMSSRARDFKPSYNIAPTTQIRIIVDRASQTLEQSDSWHPTGTAAPDSEVTRALTLARWGLVPRWAQSLSVGTRMINARVETLETKRSFQLPFATSRCVVVADGYFEWHTASAGNKTPYYFFPTHGCCIAFAGLFSWWVDPKEDPTSPNRWVLTTTIITTEARDGLEEIHHREPLMLDPEHVNAWLDPTVTDPQQLQELLAQPGPDISFHPVDSAVGSVGNNSPDLISPAPAPIQEPLL